VGETFIGKGGGMNMQELLLANKMLKTRIRSLKGRITVLEKKNKRGYKKSKDNFDAVEKVLKILHGGPTRCRSLTRKGPFK